VVERLRGFLIPQDLTETVNEARKAVASGQAPWVAISVWGFEETPISWGNSEHRINSKGGENHIVVLVFAEALLVLDILGGQDEHS